WNAMKAVEVIIGKTSRNVTTSYGASIRCGIMSQVWWRRGSLMFNIQITALREQLQEWLREDLGTGDVTSLATIPQDAQSSGILHVKDSGIVAGLPVAAEVFRLVDPELEFTPVVEEGAYAVKGT